MDNDNQGPEVKKDGAAGPLPEAPGPEAIPEAAEQALLMEKAREIIHQTPEVRPEKVAALKEALARGTYRIDSRKLANILLAEWLGRR
jgi:negative regulator of flagellin synthesis FlgM